MLHKKAFFVGILSVVGFLALFSLFMFEVTKSTVALNIDGEKTTIRTHATTVEEALKQVSISLSAHDIVVPSKETKVFDDMHVTWQAASKVTVLEDGKKVDELWTTAATVGDLVERGELPLNENDQIKAASDTPINGPNTNIQIDKAFEVALKVGTEKAGPAMTTSTTVADFLRNQEIKLRELDKVKPELDEMISKGDTVTVTRVEKVTDVVEEESGFATVTKKDKSLDKGSKKVVEQGVPGIVAKHFEVTLENGKEVSRELLKQETVKESQDKVVAIGDKAQEVMLASAGSGSSSQPSRSNSSGGREIYVKSTAYTAYCAGCSGKTATGYDLRANPGAKVIAVDPSVIPLGTKVYVEGYGDAIASDTGSAIKGNKIDVFFPSKQQAYSWGVKNVKIRILE